MRARSAHLASLVVAVALSVASPALAQQPAEAELARTFDQAQDAFERGDYAAAADAYLEFAALDTQKTHLAEALHNAAVSLEMHDRFAAASEIHLRVHAEAPKHPYASYALYRAAVTAERALNFDQAIDTYAAFHTKYGAVKTPTGLADLGISHDTLARESLASHARLLDHSHRHAEAGKAYMAFAKAYPEDPDSAHMLKSAIASFERAGKADMQQTAITVFLDRYEKDTSLWAEVTEVLVMRETHEREALESDAMADYTLQLIGDIYQKQRVPPGSPNARLTARAMLAQANREAELARRRMVIGAARIQQSTLDEMTDLFEQSITRYEQIFVYGDLESTFAAAVGIARQHEHFALALRQAQPPFPPNSASYIKLRAELDELAANLEKGALMRYGAIRSKALDVGVSTDEAVFAMERLHTLDPDTYPLPTPTPPSNVEERTFTAALMTSSDAPK